jgi:hypothetical protein
VSFEETLSRILDPVGIYWSNADEDLADPATERVVQIRIDVPPNSVPMAVVQMEADGWKFTEQPDEPTDPQQRLFFRRKQNLLPETKVAMLTAALKVVFPIDGARLWTWIILENENEL